MGYNICGAPLNKVIYLIDEYGNRYKASVTKNLEGVYVRGNCYSGNADEFMRYKMVRWHKLKNK